MIRLTKLTDYGIVLMTHIARHPERPLVTARELAAASRIPLATVSKILKALAHGDLLASHRGVNGGYSLSRTPEEISVLEIISVLEGPVGVTECSASDPGLCTLEPHCPVSPNWRVINHALHQALENVTLSALVQPAQPLAVQVGAGNNLLKIISGSTQ